MAPDRKHSLAEVGTHQGNGQPAPSHEAENALDGLGHRGPNPNMATAGVHAESQHKQPIKELRRHRPDVDLLEGGPLVALAAVTPQSVSPPPSSSSGPRNSASKARPLAASSAPRPGASAPSAPAPAPATQARTSGHLAAAQSR